MGGREEKSFQLQNRHGIHVQNEATFSGAQKGVPENNVAVIRMTPARISTEKSVLEGGANVSMILYTAR